MHVLISPPIIHAFPKIHIKVQIIRLNEEVAISESLSNRTDKDEGVGFGTDGIGWSKKSLRREARKDFHGRSREGLTGGRKEKRSKKKGDGGEEKPGGHGGGAEPAKEDEKKARVVADCARHLTTVPSRPPLTPFLVVVTLEIAVQCLINLSRYFLLLCFVGLFDISALHG